MVDNPEFSTGNNQETLVQLQEMANPKGEPYLRFYLPSGNEFAFSATGIKEVVQQAPESITPIPNTSPLLLGAINLRGEVIWVADLGQFLGETVPLNTKLGEIPVIAIEDQETILGLAVKQISEINWLDLGQLRRPNNIADSIAPFVQGEWILNAQSQQVLRLLDHIAILRSARWVA